MHSKDTDESNIRRREEALARRMGEALDRMNPQGGDACPDAEIIAAYAEQGLGPDESAHWESHFAGCTRCRKILRVLAASADTPLAGKEVTQLGELVSAVRGPAEIAAGSGKRSRRIFVDWRSGWLAPALAVAAVLAVWFATRPPWRATGRDVSQTLIAQAPKVEAPLSPPPSVSDRVSRLTPQQEQKGLSENSLNRSAGNAQSLDSSSKVSAADRAADVSNALKKASPAADDAEGQLQKQTEDNSKSPSDKNVTRFPGASAPPPQPLKTIPTEGTPASAPALQARAQANGATPSMPQVPSSTSQSVTVTEAAPTVETVNGTLGGANEQKSSTDLPINGRNFQALAILGPTAQYPTLLKAPSGAFLWRAGKGGVIERSTDAGKTWVSEISSSKEEWLAGVAVSDAVCWLVGRNGAIARTVDGMYWERIAPPGLAAAAGGRFADWTGIVARDAQAAAITASDGRKFATVDGGKTWQRQ